jgi:NADP-dependent 3-hydroxy acid dehydrogenase YdfG
MSQHHATGALAGRVAIITGASAGIGEASAHRLVRDGARVVLNARRGQRLESLANDLNSHAGRTVAALAVGDAADDAVIALMFEAARDAFDTPADLVLVNAGRGLRGGITDSDASEWEAMIRTNLLGAMRLLRRAAAELRAVGPDPDSADDDGDAWTTRPRDIVVLGSTVGRHISPFSSAYGATKFGVASLAEALRRELGPKGVRVSLIEPGIVRSEFQEAAGYDPQSFGEFMERVGPVLTPADVADSVAWLCSRPAAVHACDIVIRPTRQEYP